MKKLYTLIFGTLSLGLWAQQDIQFTQYMNNRLFFNPGVAGTSGSICLNGGHRTQWAGFDGAPVTQNINAEIPLKVLHGALLVNISNDQIGFFQDVTAGIGYSYNMSLGSGVLGIGFEVDFRSKNVSNAGWIAPDGLQDPSISAQSASAFTPDLNFGAYYQDEDLYVGVSTGRVLQSDAKLKNITSTGDALIRDQMHWYFMAGYDIDIANTDFTITPSTLVKSDLVTYSADINITALYNKKLMAGVGYRTANEIPLMIGYQILPNLRASYSYDITLSDLNSVSGGSHEIFLNYCFKIEFPPRVNGGHRNVLYL